MPEPSLADIFYLMIPEGSQIALKMFYGNPDANGDGQPDPKWEAENLVYIVPPYPMQWSWGGKVSKIRVHKKCAKPLMDALYEIGRAFTLEQKQYYQLDKCGGCYNFRLMRGSARTLSVHSYGAAIDLAPQLNGLGVAYNLKLRPNMMPMKAVEIFKKHGFTWGGLWKRGRTDCMHQQYTKPV